MNYNNPYKKSGTITSKVVCAVSFLLFAFCWLYFFQADVLMVAQHVLSEGVTSYNRTVGAIIITMVLWLLQMGVAVITKLHYRSYALTFFPSFLLLAMLSDVSPRIDSEDFTFGAWTWGVPVALLLWGGVVWVAHQVLPFDKDVTQGDNIFSRRVWVNLLQMVMQMLLLMALSNTNDVFHYSAHAETALMRGDVDEALMVGQESQQTDQRLTMLRAFALSQQGMLGEALFSYPVVGSSESLLPMDVQPQCLSADSIWKYLGAKPARKLPAEWYYEIIERDSLATPAVADYRLCGYLMDRHLSSFVHQLPHYYELSDTVILPKHYREALVLYQHETGDTLLRCQDVAVTYKDSVMEQRWADFRQLETDYSQPAERHFNVFKEYKDTYWYYYYYSK